MNAGLVKPPNRYRGNSLLKQRIITAVFMLLGFVTLMFMPSVIQALVFSVLVTIALWEFVGLSWRFDVLSNSIIATVLGAASALWAVIFLWVLSYPSSAALWAAKPSKLIQGIFLLSAAWLGFVWLINADNAISHLVYVIALVAAADIGAYFAGKTFGKHKLAPNVSPGKTWEGFMGGTVAVLLLAFAVTQWHGQIVFLSAFGFMVLAIACGFVSVVGDLYESMIKREVGAKDSSQLLPGHGGLLDRVDGLIAAVTLYTFVMINTPSL